MTVGRHTRRLAAAAAACALALPASALAAPQEVRAAQAVGFVLAQGREDPWLRRPPGTVGDPDDWIRSDRPGASSDDDDRNEYRRPSSTPSNRRPGAFERDERRPGAFDGDRSRAPFRPGAF